MGCSSAWVFLIFTSIFISSHLSHWAIRHILNAYCVPGTKLGNGAMRAKQTFAFRGLTWHREGSRGNSGLQGHDEHLLSVQGGGGRGKQEGPARCGSFSSFSCRKRRKEPRTWITNVICTFTGSYFAFICCILFVLLSACTVSWVHAVSSEGLEL